jgi:predicted nuclease with RNAse H fold
VWAGVDVGARRIHVVVIDDRSRVASADVVAALDTDRLRGLLGRIDGVAVDSPGAWSTAPHAGDESVAPKFRLGRCGEIALGREYGIWVPWSTPPEPQVGTWMATGIEVFGLLRGEGHDPVEAYPYGGFRLLAGSRLPKKTTSEGRTVRAALLRSAGVEVDGLERSHDFLDAALVALVARQRSLGTARVATCGHDQSGIWLPSPAFGQSAES